MTTCPFNLLWSAPSRPRVNQMILQRGIEACVISCAYVKRCETELSKGVASCSCSSNAVLASSNTDSVASSLCFQIGQGRPWTYFFSRLTNLASRLSKSSANPMSCVKCGESERSRNQTSGLRTSVQYTHWIRARLGSGTLMEVFPGSPASGHTFSSLGAH
ncbi:hypothetical protein OG21DRAFT_414266 [Imleria badia]|nr:hypothetical protein OG21DRAFT_414266 [Imleria badia]